MKKMDEEFEEWKSKKFSLTVPLSVVALRDSVPPSWIKVRLSSQSFCIFLITQLLAHFKRLWNLSIWLFFSIDGSYYL